MRMSHLCQKRQQHARHGRKNQTCTPALLGSSRLTPAPGVEVSIALVLILRYALRVVFLHCVHGYVSR